MGIQIKARVITRGGSHDITLPQNQNDFDKSLSDMGFYHWDYEGHTIENAKSGNAELDKALALAGNIEELNYLAQLLSHLNEDEMEKFNVILKAGGDTPSMLHVVNMAYNVNNVNFSIDPSTHDIEDLGTAYADDLAPEKDETILNNTGDDGEIDYEGIGMELQMSQGGVFSDAGYIKNYDRMVKGPYDGKHFPPYFYNGNKQVLGVTLTKRGEDKGIDIFLPAEDRIVRRAEQRLGKRLDRCDIKPCWGFPSPLAGMTLPASEFGGLSVTAQRLSVLTPDQLRELFEVAGRVNIESADEFNEFCAGKIQRLQAPEAVNTVTYYFPLDVKMNEQYEYGCEDEDEHHDPNYIDSISSSDAIYHMDSILGQIAEDNSYFETNRLLAEHLNEGTLNEKVYSMRPTVEVHDRELWGAMVMKVAGKLTPGEVAELKDYIIGQNSDGYGEGLEQREIKVNGGNLYVGFWSSEKGYAVYTQDEFQEMIEQRQTASGSSRQNSRVANDLPDCPLIGADSNVFSLMGLTSRTLKEHGMRDQANEMRERVTSSGSFDEALAIMAEYVNPVSQEDMRQSGGFGSMGM
jgi:hypothetical protein